MEELLERRDLLLMHLSRQIDADVAEVPGFGAVAGDFGVAGCVAQDKAVFVGVGSHPLAAESGSKAISDIAAVSGKIDRQTGLMLAIAWPSTLAVGH